MGNVAIPVVRRLVSAVTVGKLATDYLYGRHILFLAPVLVGAIAGLGVWSRAAPQVADANHHQAGEGPKETTPRGTTCDSLIASKLQTIGTYRMRARLKISNKLVKRHQIEIRSLVPAAACQPHNGSLAGC